MAELVAQRYGTALFELAVENNQIDKMEEEIKVIQKVLQDEPEFLELISNPKIALNDRRTVLKDVFDGKISDGILGLIDLTILKNRQEFLPQIIEFFIAKANKYKGLEIVKVTSSTVLSAEQEKQLKERMEKLTKKTIVLKLEVDESLVGGMVVRMGDRIMNYSVKGMLGAMSKALYSHN